MKLKTVIVSVAVALLCITLISYSFNNEFAILKVYAGGNPDSYGNRIVAVWIAEWNETLNDYQFPYKQCKHVYTYDGSNTFDGLTICSASDVIFHEYTDSFELKVYDNRNACVIVRVGVNKTIISDPLTETRVYLNISSVVSNQLMTATGYSTGTNFYLVTFQWNWTSNLPSAGTSYSVVIKYEVYY